MFGFYCYLLVFFCCSNAGVIINLKWKNGIRKRNDLGVKIWWASSDYNSERMKGYEKENKTVHTLLISILLWWKNLYCSMNGKREIESKKNVGTHFFLLAILSSYLLLVCLLHFFLNSPLISSLFDHFFVIFFSSVSRLGYSCLPYVETL